MQNGALLTGDAAGSFVLEVTRELAGVSVPIRLGAQSWGTLNQGRDNAILVCHYYTGTMRAAGTNPDGTPAWWDSLIGPGKAIDTDRFFVICMNTLANAQVFDPGVITTGPDTLHPDGQPWGSRFPKWTFADLHALQLDLMQALGLAKWYAVLGPSLGGMQSLYWAALTPELAPRVGAVVTSPKAGPVLRELFGPMLQDISQAGGLEGALRLISFFGFGADGIELLFRDASFNPYLRSRLNTASLAHVLDIGRLVGTHDLSALAPHEELFTRWRTSRLKLLTVNALGDQFFPAAEMRSFAQASRQAGVNHQHLEINSTKGHMACLLDTHLFAPHLQTLLETPVTEPAHA